MIDKKKLVADLAFNHGIIIDEKDPIFAAVILSENVLSEFVGQISKEQKNIIDNLTLMNELQKDEMEERLKTINKKQNKHFLSVLNEVINNNNTPQPITNNRPSIYTIISILSLGILIGSIGTYLF